MSFSRATIDPDEFKLCWKKWAETVSLFAGRRRGWTSVDPAEYESIYHTLIDGCESIDRSGPCPIGMDHRKVAEVVRPWVTTGSLAKADRELLLGLVERSSEIDGRGNSRRPSIRGVASKMVVVGSVATGVALLAARPRLLRLSPQFWMAIELNSSQMIAALIILGSIWCLYRNRRS